MLSVYPDPISEFGIAKSGLTNEFFLAGSTNGYVNEVSTVTRNIRF